MTDKEVSGLSPATLPLVGTETLHIVQGGNSRQVDVSKLPRVEFSVFASGTLQANELLYRYVATVAFRLPVALSGSRGSAGVAAAASTVLSVRKNGTAVGTATFAASGTNATMAMASATDFAAGDVLSITAPATADAALADVSISLVGGLI